MSASYHMAFWVDDIMIPITLMEMEDIEESLGGTDPLGGFSETSRSPGIVTDTEQVMLLFIALLSTD